MRRRDWRIEQIQEIEREFQVIQVAANELRKQLAANPSLLQEFELDRSDFERASKDLSGVYLVRLFAEFESGLREVWKKAYERRSHPKMADLIAAFAALGNIADEFTANVHVVRRFRNALVHEGDEAIEPIEVVLAKTHLCRFFSWLPPDW